MVLYVQMRPLSGREKECTKQNFRSAILDSLYEGANEEFLSSGNCDHCHGTDPEGIASVDGEGTDINVITDWSSTMMANSARDPYWRAKVSHEVFVNPQHQMEIEGTCTKCHAPMGRYAALLHGIPDYSMQDMLQDSVALDGVSCLACHRQAPQPEVAMHTGQLIFDPDHFAFGQYTSPLISPMAEYTGYIPEYSSHTSDSKLCASCHSLVTPTIDLAGNHTGDEFVEQATWHEWLNSSYSADNISCQSCHLPKLAGEEVILSAGFATTPRDSFALHTMAGGNTLMLGLMRDNHEALGIFAGEQAFNKTIAATNDNLINKSLQLQVSTINRTADTLYFDVKLRNTAGHKLPSGYPSRRMSVHFVATENNGNEIFRSGGFDSNYFLTSESTPYELHHNIIQSEEQVQIYEMVMGDVNSQRTTVLTQGYTHLKDNRLVPTGFTTASNVYDTTAIVLNTPDSDFNFDPLEGSGSDIIHYRVPTNSFDGELSVKVDVYYQSIPPIWLTDLFNTSTPEINTFSSMFNIADRSPVLMKTSNTVVDAYVGQDAHNKKPIVRITQTLNGLQSMLLYTSASLEVYDLNGRLVDSRKLAPGNQSLSLQLAKGAYVMVFRNETGNYQVERVIQK